MAHYYFSSSAAKYVFVLSHMEGVSRNEELELTDDLYENKELAIEWKTDIEKCINDSNEVFPDRVLALINLESIYHRILDSFEE